MLSESLYLIFPFLMIYAAFSDLFSMTISNKVSLVLMAAFMIYALLIGMDLQTIGWHWAMFGLVLAIGFALFSFGAVGGGDAKLAASTALWLGWEHTLEYIYLASIIGAGLTLAIVIIRTKPIPAFVGKIDWIARLYRADNGIPYGIALGISALLVYPGTPWMQPVFHFAGS